MNWKQAFVLGLCAPGVGGGQKEATMYSYNGVVLPKLPEWDKTKYPYAIIVHHVINSTDEMILWLAESFTTKGYEHTAGRRLTYVLNEDTNKWDFVEEEVANRPVARYYTIVWTSKDIYNNYSSSNVYIEYPASDPIPINEGSVTT